MPKPDSFQTTFDTLRALLKPYEPKLTIVMDKPRAYYLASNTSKTKSGAAVWFGGVQIMKNYVSFHLIPVYANPQLAKSLSPDLQKRMQGKSCFNFTTIEPAHVKELTALAKKGFDGFVKQFP